MLSYNFNDSRQSTVAVGSKVLIFNIQILSKPSYLNSLISAKIPHKSTNTALRSQKMDKVKIIIFSNIRVPSSVV